MPNTNLSPGKRAKLKTKSMTPATRNIVALFSHMNKVQGQKSPVEDQGIDLKAYKERKE